MGLDLSGRQYAQVPYEEKEKLFEEVKEDFAGDPFNIPEGLIQAKVDRFTGKKITADCDCDTKDAIEEWFQEGTEPTEICSQAEKNRFTLPWYLQKRTYEFDPENGEIKPSLVEIDVQSQLRANQLVNGGMP